MLKDEQCVPCRDGSGALDDATIEQLAGELSGWEVTDEGLFRQWTFKNFKAALAFVNEIGALAEAQKHHPDISFGWGFVEALIITHSAESLTRNDFILAAKIDGIAQNS